MSIVLISSDSYEEGSEIAGKTAEALGYAYLGREILNMVATRYDIPQDKLLKALDESPSIFGMPAKIRHRYLAYIEEAVLARLLEDNVVCYGLAAHLYVLGVSHVLKVGLISAREERIKRISSRAGISEAKAGKLISREEKRQRQRSLEAFRIDGTDPSFYDMIIRLSNIDPDDLVKTITEIVGYRKFKPMTYSIKCLTDRELAARVRAVLLAGFPDVRVQANGGMVVVETTAIKREEAKRVAAIKKLADGISGVSRVEVHVINDIFRQAAESFR
ncbi:MAG: cytidylate kinase-like family protein [Syntrophales bacterium]